MMNNAQRQLSRRDREQQLDGLIEAYWDERSEDFSKLRQKELSGPCAAAWQAYLAGKLAADKPLKV